MGGGFQISGLKLEILNIEAFLEIHFESTIQS
jgi:hypothetical protein